MNPIISKEETKSRVRAIQSNANDSVCVIFGAGASFGYSNEHYYKPPLVRDLFNETIPVINEVINRPSHRFIKNNSSDYAQELNNWDNDLEKYLSALYSQNRDDNLFSNFLTYLEDVFFLASENVVTGANYYKNLINKMWDFHGKKKWSCVSFNYDTILEQSYLIAGRDTSDRNFGGNMDGYLNYNPLLLKMHGGVNFRYIFCKQMEDSDSRTHNNHVMFSKMMTESGNISDFLNILYLSEGKPNPHSVKRVRDEERVYRNESVFNFPLMLIPIHESITPENIFFKKLLGSAKEEVARASLIISIGYNFGDEAFLDSIKELDSSKKDVILIGTQNSVMDIQNNLGYQRLKKTWPSSNIRIFDGDGFEGFIGAIR